MNVSEAMIKMIGRTELRGDTEHFLKVYVYAKTIGEAEGLDPVTQLTLELAAILHDIAVPLCRRKYGCADGRHQEEEGRPLVREFFSGASLPAGVAERVEYLVGHHHTVTGVDGTDYRILLEADFLVNAGEGALSPEAVRKGESELFRTAAGTSLLKAVNRLG